MRNRNKELKIKVCGMRDADNIRQLMTLPVDYIGFIFYAKSARFVSGKPDVSIPSSIKKVGVFVNSSKEEIQTKIQEFDLQVVQLHGDESPEFCQEIKDLGIETFKAFGIDEEFDWESIAPYDGKVDYFLFDTKSKQYGGTGQTFNWEKLQDYPYQTPYWLSGGISLENIEDAASFEDNRLYGLDLNSKFEIEPALKNIQSLTQAISIIK
ncbi:phosphoribosylanthranilate isomerase [Sphingobacterium sp. SGL-16]|uniref:phosphoribosylanthranilate isomerase n=1 Tax=Sphingobacterium sp. SGL-16 TaxID=2710883 RepID=UPI0013EA96CC|nr:phosphoribosylanthranilate isomerase [Sphingobacterium sp. SGL-16]NGM74642.1 phosphoribosylanthranilate isomerase [Sphingobacterium sp. SGL-16]